MPVSKKRIKEILAELKSLGTEQNLKVFARHGISGNFFGVSYANLDKLAKQLKRDDERELGPDLWASGNHDARVLASKIIDPKTITKKQATSWVREIKNQLQSCALAGLLAETEFAPALIDNWTAASQTRSLWKVECGWGILSSVAIAKKNHQNLPDSWFRKFLKEIEIEIHDSQNDIKDQQNRVVIAIGSRNEALRKSATAAAKRIGKVEVDHGDTSCKTPDAISYIEKVWARQKKS